MQNFLTNTLGPVFYGMGVSEADFAQYLGMCMGYVYGILIALGVLIIVLIAAHWLKKGVRGFTRLTAVVAFILVVAILANAVCFGPLRSNISTMMNAHSVELSADTVAQSKDTVKKVGEEGFVLLKNNGLLPLNSSVTNLNVFGWASTNPIYGGTGSGSSDSSLNTGILAGLQEAGYSTNEELTKIYTDYASSRGGAGAAASINDQSWELPEPVGVYTDSLMQSTKSFSDTAVIVVSRSGGEGADLPMDMSLLINGTYGDKERGDSVVPENYSYFSTTPDFDAGESYLELSNPEEEMIDAVCSNFDNVIVIVNANNTMELGWVNDYDSIGAVIWAPGPGVTGFSALGEIISGQVNPSGKTVDTFVKDLFDTPTSNNFGNFAYNNVDDLKKQIAAADPAYQGNMAFVNYVEGIYVGYKFYETAYAETQAGNMDYDYDGHVMYPFGYGLSYTTFDKTIQNFSADGDNVTFDVNVTNTGSVAGKEVVEIYFTPPYVSGGIEKAAVNLIQFEKTSLLEPGASETVSFSIPKEDFASYDTGIKIPGGGYILEAGDYIVSVRDDAHTPVAEETFTIASDIDYSGGRSSDLVPATNQFEDYSRGDFEQLSRADGFANYDTATAAPAEELFTMSAETRAVIEEGAAGIYDPTKYDNASDVMPTQNAQNGLVLYDLVGADYDDPRWEQLLDQSNFDEMTALVNVGGWQTVAAPLMGKIATSDCDGPAGLNNFITGAYGTSYAGVGKQPRRGL